MLSPNDSQTVDLPYGLYALFSNSGGNAYIFIHSLYKLEVLLYTNKWGTIEISGGESSTKVTFKNVVTSGARVIYIKRIVMMP